MFPELKLSRAEVSAMIAQTTPEQAAAAMTRPRCSFFDLLHLLSPAAAAQRPQMREASARCRRRYYGKTVTVYAPLYISNYCINGCRYCDFNSRHHFDRRALTLEEIGREAAAVRAMGIDSLLVVAGEDPHRMSTPFLAEVGRLLQKEFSYLSLEVAPQTEDGYRELFQAGFEGLTLFQETYNPELYRELHPYGPKSDYQFRLWSQLRAGRAGMRNLGLAFLLGLDDWQSEAASLAAHAFYLQRDCWQSKLQFAFPRLTEVSDGFQPPAPVNEADLEQLMLAFRIVFPEASITISTRERPEFRDAMMPICADNMSAGSRVTPGGYAVLADADVGQFTLNDSRSAAAVMAAIRGNQLEVVRKYWDKAL